MTIKRINIDNLEPYFDLQKYAFPTDSDSNRRERTREAWDDIIILGSYSNEELQSALIIRQYTIYMYGKKMNMGGISNVASYPGARGQGNIKELFKEALMIMKNKKIRVSYLAPFSNSFYRKFGYESVFENINYDLKEFQFQIDKPNNMDVNRVNWKYKHKIIKDIYNRKYNSCIGPIVREDWVWKENSLRNNNQHIALCTNENGKPQGYLFYHFDVEGKSKFIVDELVALNSRAEKKLWEFIKSHDTYFESFSYVTSKKSDINYLFKEPQFYEKIVPGMMARIIDMESFLNDYPFENNEKCVFFLEITEDNAEWNSGVYKLEFGNEIKGIKIEQNKIQSQKVISADIQTWTQFFMGARTGEQLHYQERLKGNLKDIQGLQSKIVSKNPELYDHF